MSYKDMLAVNQTFRCECGTHIIDLEMWDDEHALWLSWFDKPGKSPFMWRIKRAWKALTGKDVYNADFGLEKKDLDRFIETLILAREVAKVNATDASG